MRSITDIQLEIKEITNRLSIINNELESLKTKDKEINKIDFEKIKSVAKAYTIKGHPIEKTDEYTQKIYFIMLTSIVQLSRDDVIEKIRFLQRIIFGSNLNISIEEISKEALQISDKFIDEICTSLNNNELSINFAVDVMVVSNLCGKCSDEVMEYISGLFEVIRISREEIKFIMKISKAILMQDEMLYEDILIDPIIHYDLSVFKMYTEKISKERYKVYVLENSLQKIVVKAKNQVKYECNLQELTKDKIDIVLENLIINVNSSINLEFDSNCNITFKNCKFIGDGKNKYLVLKFNKCNSVIIENCFFENIKTPQNYSMGILPTNKGVSFIHVYDVPITKIVNNKMVRCNVDGPYDGESYGSLTESYIIDVCNYNSQKPNVADNEFVECRGNNTNCKY